jgi:hypothetical protein
VARFRCLLVTLSMAIAVAVGPLTVEARATGSGPAGAGSSVASVPAVSTEATSAAPPCHFQLGFAALQALIPTIVGACLDDEAYAANGDSLQHTTNGLLVWRKHPQAGTRNFTAFTDGYHSWVNGPMGLEERLNSERFAWEANPTGLPVVSTGASGVEGVVTLGPTTPVCRVGQSCSRPVMATVAVRDPAGQQVLLFVSGSDGRFHVALPPGTYTLAPLPLQPGSLYPRAVPVTIVVTAGGYTQADVTYDTGIR